MDKFLVDTNVLSEFWRTQQPNLNVKRWLEAADPRSLFASVFPRNGRNRRIGFMAD